MTTDANPPRLQIISTQKINQVWARYPQMEHLQASTNITWYREAQQLHPAAYNEIGDPAELPNSVLTGLYPEVAAFGPNGKQAVQALQALTDINHHMSLHHNENPDMQKACDELFDAVKRHLQDPHWGVFFPEEKGLKWKIIGPSLLAQRKQTNIKTIAGKRGLQHPLVIYLAASFAAQLTAHYKNPYLPALIHPISEPWSELQKAVTAARINTYMPELQPETYQEAKIALPLRHELI